MRLIDDEANRPIINDKILSKKCGRGKVADLSINPVPLKTPSRSSQEYIQLECDHCHRFFSRSRIQYEKARKIGLIHTACSFVCSGFLSNQVRKRGSVFSYFIRTVKDSVKTKRNILDYNLTAEYLEELWNKQEGICPYTGIKMILPNKSRYAKRKRHLTNASLDRIDSSKGYVEGNVEFVCLGINYAKNCLSKQETLDFIELIRTHSPN